jgi:toxin ParE1/3/4
VKVFWNKQARRDLRVARAYIARDDSRAADQQVRRVLAAVDSLQRFPERGRPGRRLGTREMSVVDTPYIMAYRLLAGEIQILRVMHERQSWPDIL